ncbi:MAG: GNAT family N-acetyltransferase [Phycisphaerales bacterium]|nr:MAG: GNAT family N-acetyltransferase [Phycisphaerales bacterium]
MGKVQVIDATADTIGQFGFCGYKSTKQEGYRRKTEWLKKRFAEGMRFKILHSPDDGAVGFIEYIPGEFAWRPITAPGYLVIHCLMINRREYKGHGYGELLVKHCLQDARRSKSRGVAVVTSSGTWMAGKELFLRCGFEAVATAPPSYELLVRKLAKAPFPKFKDAWDEKLRRYGRGLVIIRSDQCPCIAKFTTEILQTCKRLGVRARVVDIENHRQAQDVPWAYGVFGIVHDSRLVADHPVSKTRFRNIMRSLGIQ